MSGMMEWLRVQSQKVPGLYEALRALKHGFRPRPSSAALPPAAFRARIEAAGPLRFEVAEVSVVPVAVHNESPHAWPAGAVALSYHWRRMDESLWGFDGGRAVVGHVASGASRRLQVPVRPPSTPATYWFELDLVHGADAWFAASGSQPFRREVLVEGMRPDKLPEIDYERIYAEADLKKDYWGVVGPASAEEFRQLGRGKLDMLKALGLRPDSKLLDVGCGTGSLAEPMEEFLGPDGLYFGTDLSEVAVEFCKEKYRRPNFLFAKNGMTTLPIEGREFDFVVFFSVFTHTYPKETAALLKEAARVLAAGGSIVADVFESDIEGESLGTRAMTVLPPGRVADLAADAGLEARTLSQFAWDPTGPRQIDRVLRRFARPGVLSA
jgi:SAM-dependent methyltransferase